MKTRGDKVSVAAHSLGNMVVGVAIQDKHAVIDNYFAIDAAVALEAYDLCSNFIDYNKITTSMVKVENWETYWDYDDTTKKLFASEWYKLFDTGDSRSKLTWRGRLDNVVNIPKMYNFYSSTEEVLAEYEGDNVLWDGRLMTSDRAWVRQEKFKGRLSKIKTPDIPISDPLLGDPVLLPGVVVNVGGLGSPYAGWGFNLTEPAYTKDGTDEYGKQITVPRSPSELGPFDESYIERLKTTPFFLPTPSELFGTNGSSFVSKNVKQTSLYSYYDGNMVENVSVQDWLLAEAFPATTLPAGANTNEPLERVGTGRNIDMSKTCILTTVKSKWPRKSDTNGNYPWLHGDFVDVSYQHNQEFYRKINEFAK